MRDEADYTETSSPLGMAARAGEGRMIAETTWIERRA
jgi:hypothetical protein